MTGIRPTEWLSAIEVKKLMSSPDIRSRQGLRDHCVIRVLAETGMRKGELITLKNGSLANHNDSPILRVQTLKKRRKEAVYRTIPIAPDLEKLLRRCIEREHGKSPDPEQVLFTTMGVHGNCVIKPITPRAIDLIVQRYLSKAGINKRITSHSLRHTNATRLLEKGADVETVRLILGHSSLSSTQRYVHSTEDRKREAIENLRFSDE